MVTKKSAAKKTAPRKKTAARKRPPAGGSRRSLPTKIRNMAEGSAAHAKILLYSRPGQGKTSLIVTGGSDHLVLEADRGESVARRFSGPKPKVWEVLDHNDMEEALEYLGAGGGHKDFEMVWLDSLTFFQQRGLEHIMEDVVAAKPTRKLWQVDRGEYGQNMTRVTRHVRNLQDLPMHVGITCHLMTEDLEVYEGDEEEEHPQLMPFVHGKGMSQKICGMMDVVARMELKTNKSGREYTVFDSGHVEGWYTKDRYGLGRIVQPTMDKIMEVVNNPKPVRTGSTK